MAAIPRYRPQTHWMVFSVGFRPFFLLAAVWAAVAVPVWVLAFTGAVQVPGAMPPAVWHGHEMVFGFGQAVVAGFLLTAIPNWTGRMPLQGWQLAGLVLLWLLGRIAMLLSASLGPVAAGVLDLAFPLVFLAAVAREILAGRNWHNLPMLLALGVLFAGSLLVHLGAPALGNRLGVATLLMLISLVGGRIVPSFTRNWLARQQPGTPLPAGFGWPDRAALGLTVLALASWALAPDTAPAPWLALAAGVALAVRLSRWRGAATVREPLLGVLHLGYAWLAAGLVLLALPALIPALPASAAMHALTVGAIGTMTLAVMSRVTLGHSGRALVAGPGTVWAYGLVSLAALLRIGAPLGGVWYAPLVSCAGLAWSAAFALFIVLYGPALLSPRRSGKEGRTAAA